MSEPDPSTEIPASRIRRVNDAPVRTDGNFVLYWMIANRRPTWSFSLQRAADHARALEKPLVVLEALRCDYRWASDRIHRFVLDGMLDNAEAFSKTPVLYHPYVEPELGAGKGLLEALGEHACLAVTDEFPCFFLPRMVEAAGRALSVRLECVDSNGLMPLRASERAYPTAYQFRRHIQKTLPQIVTDSDFAPIENPLDDSEGTLAKAPDLPSAIHERWPATPLDRLRDPAFLAELPIDHEVAPVADRGGTIEAHRVLDRFLSEGLPRYGEERNQPEAKGVTSTLSAWLHFGHISAHEIFDALAQQEDWTPEKLRLDRKGAREGFWNMSPSAEGWLDQLVTWRELGYNMGSQRDDYDRYESLPDWAKRTLADHEADPRDYSYSLRELTRAETHDEVWNAAQNQLLREGRIHNYLRMLWGKKVLRWSATPREALDTLIELNNRYAIDGRNPNSYSGIFWTLGRYDRPFGPERPIIGKVRTMTSSNTKRKLRLGPYLDEYRTAKPRDPETTTARLPFGE